MTIITRSEARRLGLKIFFDGEECKKGHISDKYTETGSCLECIEERNQENKLQYEDRSKRFLEKKFQAKEALSFIRETLSEIDETVQAGLISNITCRTEDLDILPRSKRTAEILDEEYYDTGLPCEKNHLSKRFTKSGECVQCVIDRRVEYKPWVKVKQHERRVALKEGGSFTKSDIDLMLLDQDFKCVYCKADLNSVGYHIDHIIPVSKGGSNYPENLQCLCPRCNLRKSAKMPEDYEREIGFNRDE